MRKFRNVLFLSVIAVLAITFLTTQPAFAADGDVAKVDNLMKSILSLITWIGGGGACVIAIAVGAVLMGLSSGNPERLSTGKNAILWACVGIVVLLGANIFAGVITDTTNGALGK